MAGGGEEEELQTRCERGGVVATVMLNKGLSLGKHRRMTQECDGSAADTGGVAPVASRRYCGGGPGFNSHSDPSSKTILTSDSGGMFGLNSVGRFQRYTTAILGEAGTKHLYGREVSGAQC